MDKQIKQLQELLQEQIASHTKLSAMLTQKRAAVAKADHVKVAEMCRAENEMIQRISETEKTRLKVSAEITLLIKPGAAEPMSLLELAQALPEPVRGQLLVTRMELRQRIEAVRQESAVIRRASESLLRHMQGLVQSIGGAVTGIGTYSRNGNPPRAAMAISTFNLTA